MPRILVRFDDVNPMMDYRQWNRAMELMQRYHIKPLLGVVPDCKDPELILDAYHDSFWDEMRLLKHEGYSIAMHGFSHIFDSEGRGIMTEYRKSEFAGHNFETQRMKICDGKQIMKAHGLDTDVFFAPAHSYDAETLKALSSCGFRYVLDGRTCKPVAREGIRCIPCQTIGVPTIGDNDRYYTIILHTNEWNRTDKEYVYDKLSKTLKEHAADFVTFEAFCERKNGYLPVQKLAEKSMLCYERRIRPGLVNLKRRLKG